jgi:hypothetical protein
METRVLNSGSITILDILENLSQMWTERQSCWGFDNIKNYYATAQIAVADIYLKLMMSNQMKRE